jgi:hypothetical protein
MAGWQILTRVTGGVLMLVTLAGCGPRAAPSAAPDASPSDSRAIEEGDQYVALGDSYTAAPRTGPDDNACKQSTTNYPHRVAAKLDLKLQDVSCGGARTTHATEAEPVGSSRRPPQLRAISRGTDLVTVSLGGTDFSVLPFVGYFCTALRSQDPNGAPCQEADTAPGRDTFDHKLSVVQRRLVAVLEQVAKRAPHARVLVVSYPEVFPANAGFCPQLPLAHGDYAFAHRLNTLLVRAQKRAAERAHVEYVDVFTPSKGHDMCAQDPWIAGLRPERSDAAPLHPYPEEQRLVADLLVQEITGAPSPKREQPVDH